MKLYHGTAEHYLPKVAPELIVTDAPKRMLDWLIRYAEQHDCVVIDIYSRNWLTGSEYAGEKHWEPFERILSAFPASVICDPFMGTGAIGIAALHAGHDFIGIETDSAKFNHARSRLLAAQDATTGSD